MTIGEMLEHIKWQLEENQRAYEKLYDECDELYERIDKAINYIKKESWYMYKDNEEVIDRTPVNKLLDILEGKNE